MKKYIRSMRILMLVLILIVAVGAFAGAPLLHIWQQRVTPVETAETTHNSMAEELALKKLLSVFSRMSEVTSLYATGSFNAVDPSDPDNKIGTSFIYSQDREQLYYRIGNQEIVALPDIYIAVNHDIKKIFVSDAKTILPPMQMPVDSLLRLWKNENYTISETTTGNLTTVDLRCDNHITCKEYKAVYDAEKLYVTSVYMRLTNLDDPFNEKKDKQITVSFSRWEEGKTPPALFHSSQYIRKEQGAYLPAARFKGYELMTSF